MLTPKLIYKVPDGLLNINKVTDLHQLIPQPTLLKLTGENTSPLFLSVLLHANEFTSFFAVQKLLKKYQNHKLPRSIIIFFGNIEASKLGVRRLPGQVDYNRVWPGTDLAECDETRLMKQVVNEVTQEPLFASIDIHNNTGKNPHYGCINSLDDSFLRLASLFSRTVVYFETPKGVQSMAMAPYCPAITIECGQPNLQQDLQHAFDFIDTVLHLQSLDTIVFNKRDIDVFQTHARVIVNSHCEYSFSDESADIVFNKKLERLNFTPLNKPTVFGKVKNDRTLCLQALDQEQRDVTSDYFMNNNQHVILHEPMMPAMLTLNEDIIRQDCLCYLMKRIDL